MMKECIVVSKKENRIHKQKTGWFDDDEDEDLGIAEDELVEILKKVFFGVSSKLKDRKITLRQLFKTQVMVKEVSGNFAEIISQISFVRGIKSLGILELDNFEYCSYF